MSIIRISSIDSNYFVKKKQKHVVFIDKINFIHCLQKETAPQHRTAVERESPT